MFGRSWRRATPVALVMIGVALSFGAVRGLAHAEPDTANPPIGGSVEMAPPVVEIVFSQEVTDGTAIEVFGPDGRPVHAAPAEIDLNDPDRKRVTVALYGNLPAGVYTVNWTAVSAEDDHSESGSFTFTVTTGSASAVTASPEASPVASPAASPVASPVAGAAGALSAREQANLIADEAQRQATQQASQEDNLDERDLGLAVLPGIAVGLGIYLFWRRVRPKPEERVFR